MSRRSLVSSSVDNIESMHIFFREWLTRQEAMLEELQTAALSLSPDSVDEDEPTRTRLSELLQRVMAHYNEYYHAKSRVAQENVFLVFSPTWMTSLERSFLWIAGFKPDLAFQIVDKFVLDLSREQLGRILETRELTRMEEKELSDELARIQETVAAPPVLELARRAARAVDGELVDLEAALGGMKRDMENLVECADFLRFRSVMRILSVLKAGQGVRFFAALTQFQMQIRRWGTQREAAAAQSQ